MATYNLQINFTSLQTGDHRVCWRTTLIGPYDCSTIVACAGGGNPCTATVTVDADDESCDNIDFNGYVQPTCFDIGDVDGRVPFSITFSPVQPCVKWNATCGPVEVAAFELTGVGFGYGVLETPAVTVIGGGGAGVIANGVITDGAINSVTITNPGAGYVDGTYTLVPAQTVTGVGSGALFEVVVAGGVVVSANITPDTANSGTGYAGTDTVDFNNADLGGAGAGVLITIDAVDTGTVQYINITNPGSGFTSQPTATVDGPIGPGSAATVDVILELCPTFLFGNDCNSTPVNINESSVGTIASVCAPLEPILTAPVPWIVNQEGCCYDCSKIKLTKISEINGAVSYIDCVTKTLIYQIVGNTPIEVCAITDSWYVTAGVVTIDIQPEGCLL